MLKATVELLLKAMVKHINAYIWYHMHDVEMLELHLESQIVDIIWDDVLRRYCDVWDVYDGDVIPCIWICARDDEFMLLIINVWFIY